LFVGFVVFEVISGGRVNIEFVVVMVLKIVMIAILLR